MSSTLIYYGAYLKGEDTFHIKLNLDELILTNYKIHIDNEKDSPEQSNRNSNKIKELEMKLTTLNKSMEQLFGDLMKFDNTKADKKSFTTEMDKLKHELNTVKNDLEENRNRTATTENYLEKYLPLRIQNIISENFHNTFESVIRRKFVKFEKLKYEKLNDVILKDDGKPNLNKTEVYIPPLEKVEKSIPLDQT